MGLRAVASKPLPVVANVRVSTTVQNIERQRADDVMTHDLGVVDTFTDKTSASLYATKIRKDYEALELIACGQVDGKTIWVSNASRMSRNMEQFGPLRKLCREHKVRCFIRWS